MRGKSRGNRLKRQEDSAVETLILQGDPVSVRDGLTSLMASPMMLRLTEDSQGTVQIVLAEVLNNIAEHAYATYPGQIEVVIEDLAGEMFFQIKDSGLPMPGGELPGGKLSEERDLEYLPEGGFGWYLIRSLTTDLTYARANDANLLNYCVNVEYSE